MQIVICINQSTMIKTLHQTLIYEDHCYSGTPFLILYFIIQKTGGITMEKLKQITRLRNGRMETVFVDENGETQFERIKRLLKKHKR